MRANSSPSELRALITACQGNYADLVLVVGMSGLRCGEAAGPQVGDVIAVPGPGLRLQRALLSSGADSSLFVDSLKNRRSRTVPLVSDLLPIMARGRQANRLFGSRHGSVSVGRCGFR